MKTHFMIRSESVTALSAFVQSFSSSALRRAVLFFSLLLACTSVGTAQELPDFVKGTEADPLLERLKSDRQGLASLTVEQPGLERAAAAPVPFTTSITDHEGNSVDIVVIGEQVWYGANAEFTTFRDGTPIPLVQDSLEWSLLNGPARSVLEPGDPNVLDPLNAEDYARTAMYYTHAVTTDPRGVCPDGWRVPAEFDWENLTSHLGGMMAAGTKMKSTSGWQALGSNSDRDPNGTNESGFNAYPTGYRTDTGEFYYRELFGGYWATNEVATDTARIYHLSFFFPDLFPMTSHQNNGWPIRCMRDLMDAQITSPIPDVITDRSVTVMADVFDDGGLPVVSKGVLIGDTPTVDFDNNIGFVESQTDGEGEFTVMLQGLLAETQYYVRAYADRGLDTAYSATTMPFTTLARSTCVEGVDVEAVDVDGNRYQTVCIGGQLWFASNLEVDAFRNGDVIQESQTANQWAQLYNARTQEPQRGRRINPGNPLTIIDGQFYNFFAASDLRGLCPVGWHVPTNTEMDSLSSYLGGDPVAGGSLKSLDVWRDPNTGATNSTGFNALPTGFIYSDGGFYDDMFIRTNTRYWTSTESTNSTPENPGGRFVGLLNSSEELDRGGNTAWAGFSVRCLRNDDPHYVYEPVQESRAGKSLELSASHLDVEDSGLKSAGFVWSSQRAPSLDVNEGVVYADDLTGSTFRATLSGFDVNKPLYVRSFVTGTDGTQYLGPQSTFDAVEGLVATLGDAVAGTDGYAEMPLFVEGYSEADSVSAYQFDLPLPPGVSFQAAITEGTLSDGSSQDPSNPSTAGTLLTNVVFDGKGNSVLKVVYSTKGFLKSGSGTTPLLKLQMSVQPGVQATLTPTSFLVNAESVAAVGGGTVTGSFAYGDVDGDGRVLAYDASIVLNYVVGVNILAGVDPGEWEPGRVAAADVDGVGGIMAMDASYILQYVVQMIDAWPVESQKAKTVADPAVRTELHGDTLRILVDGEGLRSLELTLPGRETLEYGEPLSDWDQAMIATSRSEDGGVSIALASATPFDGQTVLRIPVRLTAGAPAIQVRGEVASNQTRSEIGFTVESTATGVSNGQDGTGTLPERVELLQNYPNPFNPATQVRFALPEAESIRLDVFDLMGRRVAVLAEGTWSAGYHTVTFDATGLANGMYVYRLSSPSVNLSRSMVLLK